MYCFNADPTGYVNFRVNVGGSQHNSGYYVSTDGSYGGSSPGSNYYKQMLWNSTDLQHGGWNAPTVNATGTNNGFSAEYTFYNPSETTFHKNVTVQFGSWERANNYTYTGNSFLTVHTTSALTGFTIQNNSGSTFRAGSKISLYGLK